MAAVKKAEEDRLSVNILTCISPRIKKRVDQLISRKRTDLSAELRTALLRHLEAEGVGVEGSGDQSRA